MTQVVRWTLWPAYAGIVVALLVFADANGAQGGVRTGLAIGTLLVVLALEQWLPLEPHAGVRGDRAVGSDLGHLVANGFGEAAGNLSLLAGALLLAPLLQGAGIALWPSAWPYALQCLLAIVGMDFLDYWTHRALHQLDVLWPIHAVHHDIDRLHILRSPRSHFLTVAVRFAMIFVPVLLLGAPVEMLFWWQTLLISTGSIAHANLDLRFPAAVHRLVVTPPVHRIHHARAAGGIGRNFAAVLPLWDWLFGSYEQPQADVLPEIGVDGGGAPSSFAGQIAWPFVVWLRMAASALKRAAPNRAQG